MRGQGVKLCHELFVVLLKPQIQIDLQRTIRDELALKANVKIALLIKETCNLAQQESKSHIRGKREPQVHGWSIVNIFVLVWCLSIPVDQPHDRLSIQTPQHFFSSEYLLFLVKFDVSLYEFLRRRITLIRSLIAVIDRRFRFAVDLSLCRDGSELYQLFDVLTDGLPDNYCIVRASLILGDISQRLTHLIKPVDLHTMVDKLFGHEVKRPQLQF